MRSDLATLQPATQKAAAADLQIIGDQMQCHRAPVAVLMRRLVEIRSVGLTIRSCLEPRVDQGVLEMLAPTVSVRSWTRDALFRLPMALIRDPEHA